jgi:lipase chaperone LimK
MRITFARYGIFSTIVAAVFIGIGVAYVLQKLEYGRSADVTVQSHVREDTAIQPIYVFGPGGIAPPSHSREPDMQVKSKFKVDKNGDLLIDQDTESALDSLLATLPADPTTAQVQKVEAAARAGLPDKAAIKATALFREYAAYRKAFDLLPAPPEPGAPLGEKEAFHNKVAYLRSRHFDTPTLETLFGVREAQRIYSSEVMRVVADNTLSAAEKEQRIRALHQALPPKIGALEFNNEAFSAALEQQVATLRLRNASEEDVRNLRHQYFGIERTHSAKRSVNEK